ncbi:MAG: class I SAM-dependent methyltransferase [Candidatus Coatesbacteria bacterium]|nr:class I SAM-dependent methyltransferase [Candidatus Coatesbacteria bacterium]
MSRQGVYKYEPFLSEYYDLVPAYAKRADLDFYVEAARLSHGRVLELGCGTGRILIPIAAAGFDIVGLDISESMLGACKSKLQAQPPEVRERISLILGDMTAFDLEGQFGLITTPFRSFQHLISVQAQLACLNCVRRHLAPGGRFILELFQTYPRRMYDTIYMKEVEDTPEFEMPDGRRLRRTNRTKAFHRTEQFNEVEIIYYCTHPDGRTERFVQAFPFRYFFRYEVEHLLVRAGFDIIDLFGNFDKSPLTDDSPEMIFVAEKSC